MTDWTRQSARAGESAAEQAAREEKHSVIIELLAAYADGELPPETRSQIDAHLVGCARCRRELTVHHALRQRLGAEPPVAATPALRERIGATIAATPIDALPASVARPRVVRAAVIGLLVSAVVALVWAGAAWDGSQSATAVEHLTAAPASMPLVRGVLADYRRVTARDLPGRARDLDAVRAAVPFPFEPLHAAGIRLLAAWTTEIDGEPAAVLAYRWDDRIVLQYFVPETRFFQYRDVRQAVADGSVLVASDGTQAVAAWPTKEAGTLLVADASPGELVELARPLVRRANGVAQ